MGDWNFADVWEVIADTLPDAPALAHGDTRRTWAELDRRADGLALTFLEHGLERQDKVAQYLYNCNEYLESMFAAWKAGMVPVNTNYRYVDDELVYLWDNADVRAVVFHGAFAERIERLRTRVPLVRVWLWVDDDSGPCPDWAVPYEDAAGAAGSVTTGMRVTPPWDRTGDDLHIIYTGGTTGLPKGVMWRQDDLYRLFSELVYHDPPDRDLDAVRARLTGPSGANLAACPLMHGTGALSTIQTMTLGGSTVTLKGRTFDVVELLDTVQNERVTVLTLVGDAFAKPLLQALDAEPGRWDISSLFLVVSSGVMWSEPVKQGLLRHNGGMMLVDVFSSSEALGIGQSVSTAAATPATAAFQFGRRTRVITDDGRDVAPGTGEVGRVAVRGITPIGYYKDPDKSARTFPVIDGERYTVPGDYATVDADGTIRLLGRGSVCINTGGEKVFPEEVEEALKEHPSVFDAVVVGVPDDRFGEAVTALVELRDGTPFDETTLIDHVRGRLAAYKAPKRILALDTVGRAPNGKVDYRRLRDLAASRLGAPVISP